MSGDKALAVDLKAEGVAAEKFAADAATVLRDNARVEVEVSPSGVILRGVWEFDIEQAIEELKEALALRMAWSPPRILYKEGPRLLEPIMRVRLMVPEDSLGDVIGDINSRRGLIQGTDSRGNAQAVTAMVPLANMFGYVNQLRSFTQGRANYSMFFDHYDEVPANVAAEVKEKLA